MGIFIFILGSACIALSYVLFATWQLLSSPTGNTSMCHIANAIKEGANAFLKRQYFSIALVGIFMCLFLGLILGKWVSLGFFIGAFLSSLSGITGMNISIRANVRTAQAAKTSLSHALDIALKGGAITGMQVIALGVIGLAGYYLFLLYQAITQKEIMEALLGLSFGASLVSIFARLGGGIFTKGADIGADLVGKLEAKIPEDDPRNPAVIADNVGDNVGDCAGMAADLFETYVVTIVASMLIISLYCNESQRSSLMVYPLLIGAVCVLGSILGIFAVKLKNSENIMWALYKGLIVCSFSSFCFILVATYWLWGWDEKITLITGNITSFNLLICTLVGFAVTGSIVLITEYYTSTRYSPVKSLACASQTGHATNIIQGLALSMQACALPMIVICIGLLMAYLQANLVGIAIAATSMLSLMGFIVTMDAYGPITDNAGGIAQMSNLPNAVRTITDKLDAVGNTTKAITKGYAICSAGLAALVLFVGYTKDLEHYLADIHVSFTLDNPFTVIGLFIGGLLPYLFASLAMMAVSKAGGQIVIEVRRQFQEIDGLIEGKAKPEYGLAVDILTKTAIREMLIPSLLPVFSPCVLWGIIYFIAGIESAFTALGAMLLGTIITGIFVAISMTSGGGAWDNAKKYIEEGNFGGKNSLAYQAAITGDTVGDPYKDTAGPAVNPMIKITNIVSLLLLAIVSAHI